MRANANPWYRDCLTYLELGILALSKGAGEDGLGEGDYREEDLGNLHDACSWH